MPLRDYRAFGTAAVFRRDRGDGGEKDQGGPGRGVDPDRVRRGIAGTPRSRAHGRGLPPAVYRWAGNVDPRRVLSYSDSLRASLGYWHGENGDAGNRRGHPSLPAEVRGEEVFRGAGSGGADFV